MSEELNKDMEELEESEVTEADAKTAKVTSNENTRILWNAPSTWLVISKKTNILNSINEKCDDDNFAVTNISHSRAVIQI